MASPLALAMMMPQGNAPGQLQPTNVLGAYNLSQNAAEQNYQAQLAQQNAMWGGLAGLGSAGILAAPKLFGAGGPLASSAASAAAPAAASAAAAPLDLTAPAVSDAAAAAWPAAADLGTGAFTAGAPVAADLAATAAPVAADATAAGSSIADLLPFLATLFA